MFELYNDKWKILHIGRKNLVQKYKMEKAGLALIFCEGTVFLFTNQVWLNIVLYLFINF